MNNTCKHMEMGKSMGEKSSDFGVTGIVHDWKGDSDVICIWITKCNRGSNQRKSLGVISGVKDQSYTFVKQIL